MFLEEFMQGLLLSFMSWYHSETDIQKTGCHISKIVYAEYVDMLCVNAFSNEDVQRETATSVYYPNATPPYPAIILVSGSSPAHSDSMMERKAFFLKEGLAVVIIDSFTPARILKDCFQHGEPCSSYLQIPEGQRNTSFPLSQECPTINNLLTKPVYSLLQKSYLDRISKGFALSPAERSHDLYEALKTIRKNKNIDSENLVIVGYSHGGSVVLESMTFTENKIAPPGDEVFSEEDHSLEGVRAAVAYYPNCRPGTYFHGHAKIKNINLQIHLANRDQIASPDRCQSVIDTIRNAQTEQQLQTFRYDEHHAFDMREYDSAYSEKSKKFALDRTLKFIRRSLDPKYH